MAHVAIAARLDSYSLRLRRIANELEALVNATGSGNEDLERLIERHRALANDLTSNARATRETRI